MSIEASPRRHSRPDFLTLIGKAEPFRKESGKATASSRRNYKMHIDGLDRLDGAFEDYKKLGSLKDPQIKLRRGCWLTSAQGC